MRGCQEEPALCWLEFFGTVLIYLKFILKSNVLRSPDKNRKKEKKVEAYGGLSLKEE